MMELMRFVFSSFWIWVGTLFLIVAVGHSFAMSITAVKGMKP